MSDPGIESSDPSLPAVLWRPAGLVYFAVCLASLAVGMFPLTVYPFPEAFVAAPRPTLQTLAVGQALFILLVHPAILLLRGRPRPTGRFPAEALLEPLCWLVATTPLYIAAAWLADATAGDVARTALCLLCLWPVAVSAAALLRRWPAARPAVFLLLLILAAAPGVYYIAREFLGVFEVDWLWDLAPATFIWSAAQSRAASLLPHPLWPPLTWLALAAALAVAASLRKTDRQSALQ